MLRRKLSAGLLRPTLPSPQATPICPPSPVRPRSRSLASAVLLSSQRNWKSETVVTLKSELKKRGLSQQGNKATLVTRLESSETSNLLGPLPPFPSSTNNTNGNSIPNGIRSISTSATLSQPPKSSKKGTTSSPANSSSTDTKEDPQVLTTGPQISSQRTEAIKVDPIEPEQITVAPGLPQSDVASSSSGERLDLRFPGSQSEQEVDQVIPLTPDNFSSGVSSDSAPSLPAPKVLTVASASTHLEGGPVHGTHESTDAHEFEKDNEPSIKDLPGLGEALRNVLTSPARAWTNSGIKLPEINLPKSSESKNEYKSEKRGLNDDERRGVWVLAGVLTLGLALGGGGGSTKSKKSLKEKANEAVEANGIPGAKVVKGDAKWEKASGAGVVGHGARKD
ncbi:uncharacterized protein I206_104652 [Kwoniella pini CBS 10737]|uniref:SAP domain-containing protein n=1 Tax=Kwoniella pini CBS 10737 TaxID=1296096 RepID=A0A1B9I7N0_9TREE|nr:uncharacterized protein I206_02190 [Kwoniella pini CBS 10737]OCF51476.1 hypothetical protein I206_02190 [Kwoniella pini CBS 10737]